MSEASTGLSFLMLAAGAGERRGLGPKGLLELRGRPLLCWLADKARMQQQRHILPGWFAESPVQLALAAGIEMHAVPGEAHNLKITTAEDWRLAQQLAHLLG